jgi:glutaredoxin-like YruB-family protein
VNIKTGLLAASFMMCTLGAGVHSAEMYKWVDKEGVIHLQDYPPQDIPSSTRVEKRQFKQNPEPISKSNDASGKKNSLNNQTINANPQVEIYTTSWCPYCKQAKDYLNSKGISYTEHDVEKSPEALRRRNELVPAGGVPVAVINGRVISGFSSKTYDAVLGGTP